MQVSESLTKFVRAQQARHHDPALLERWSMDMETQVNVLAGDGEPVDDKRNTWTDGTTEWFNFRVPKNANSDPYFNDWTIRFPLDDHVEAIGSTGWDWKNRVSRWVGFDFDTITGHAAGVGITDAELRDVQEVASSFDFVEVRRSTGGGGIHLYVLLDAIPTANHNEHAALARAVLGMLSSESGFDFAAQVDACGGNMWIWHRKAWKSDGLSLIKAAERSLTVEDLPLNWRDHLEVISRKRSKVRLVGVNDDTIGTFDELAASRPHIPLDDKHRAIIDTLMKTGFSTVWVADHHLLQTHTAALKEVHEKLQLRGLFDTNSGGTDPGTPNCFLFPESDGGWMVYRFTQGIVETAFWKQDGSDWTTCRYNKPLDLETACRAFGGVEDPDKGGWTFADPVHGVEAAKALGAETKLPALHGHALTMRTSKDGRLVIDVSGKEVDGMERWVRKRGKYTRVFNVQIQDKDDKKDFDPYIRHLVLPNGEEGGWAVHSKDGWRRKSKDNVKSYLCSIGYKRGEIEEILGGAVIDAWTTVNIPFQPEYPGDRRWNINAPQLRYAPADEEGPHVHWDLVLSHVFSDLTDALVDSEWAKSNNIKTGYDYGLLWLACLLREPFDPLPYLFLHGIQNSGKSILHEAISCLMTSGVCSADRALSSHTEFNGELANAVLAVVEERDLSQAGESVYNRIKDWVTSRTLWVRKMRTDAYPQPNTLHFIQCANNAEACPVFPGDTRITVLRVHPPKKDIPKTSLIAKLKEEGPHFMRTLMDLQLPNHCGRMRLCAIATESKRMAEEYNQNPVVDFLNDCADRIEGQKVPFAEVWTKFIEWLEPDERSNWNRKKLSMKLPDGYPRDRGKNNKAIVRNIKWRDTK